MITHYSVLTMCVRVSLCRFVDTSDAVAVPGVVAFISAKDIPGSNMTGPVVYDETVFADDKVFFYISVNFLCSISN